MAKRKSYSDIDPDIVLAVYRKVGQVKKNYQLSNEDLDDLSQELFMHAIKNMHKYEPARSCWKTFIDRMLTSYISNFMRTRNAKTRKLNYCAGCIDNCSLDTTEAAIAVNIMGQIINNTGCTTSPTDNVDLQLVIEGVLPLLSTVQRQICILILQGYTLAEVSRILKLHRTSLYHHMMQIQKIFISCGFENYFENSHQNTPRF